MCLLSQILMYNNLLTSLFATDPCTSSPVAGSPMLILLFSVG